MRVSAVMLRPAREECADRGTRRAPQTFGIPETPVGIEPTSTGLQPVAWPSGSSVQYPRQESNLIPDLRRVVCHPPHPEDRNIPARIRTGIQTLGKSDVVRYTTRTTKSRRLDSH